MALPDVRRRLTTSLAPAPTTRSPSDSHSGPSASLACSRRSRSAPLFPPAAGSRSDLLPNRLAAAAAAKSHSLHTATATLPALTRHPPDTLHITRSTLAPSHPPTSRR